MSIVINHDALLEWLPAAIENHSYMPISHWCYHKTFMVNMRVCYHWLGNDYVRCIAVANIQNQKSERGKGQFWELLEVLFTYKMPIVIECIINENLYNSLIRKGYKEVFVDSLYKLPT